MSNNNNKSSDSSDNTSCSHASSQTSLRDDERSARMRELLEALESLRLPDSTVSTNAIAESDDEFMHNILSAAINIAEEYDHVGEEESAVDNARARIEDSMSGGRTGMDDSPETLPIEATGEQESESETPAAETKENSSELD
jgi:hypothetical protein